jgi:hypothetical protein
MPLDYEQTAVALIRGAEDAVAKAVAPLLRRIEELEARQPDKGEKGDRGEDGRQGRDGLSVTKALVDRDGHLRLLMADGSDHDLGLVVGKDGKDGERGLQGDPGERGADGKDGIDGKDGGNGADGRDGIDGKDAYPGEARGLYDPEATYRALDVVSLNGSEWRAKKDDPGPLPGDGWMLSAQRGKRGEQGQRGERGMDGKSGKDGAQPIQFSYDLVEMKQLIALDTGEVLEADISDLIRAIREEE